MNANGKTHKEFVSEVRKTRPTVKVIGKYVGARDKVKVRCRRCGTGFRCSASSLCSTIKVPKGGGCPACRYDSMAKSRIDREGSKYASKVKRFRNLKVVGSYVDGYTPIKHECKVHGHFLIAPNNLLIQKHGCKKCATESTVSSTRWSKTEIRKRLEEIGLSVKSVSGETLRGRVSIKCPEHGSYDTLAGVAFYSKYHGCSLCVQSNSGSVKTKTAKIRGRTIKVQGYEEAAILWLVKHRKIPVSQIRVSLEPGMPTVEYRYKSVDRKYHPDLFIKRTNRVIEVKSLYTLAPNRDVFNRNKAKARAATEAGFKFTLMVMRQNGERFETPRNWTDMTFKEIKSLLADAGR